MKTIELPEDIRLFRDKHNACEESLEWTAQNCTSMQDVWDKAMPEWLIWVATRPGVLDDRTLRLYACWCARHAWHLLTDVRSRNAVEVAERFANGDATKEELATARDAAWYAACDTWYAAWDAWYAAWDAWYAAQDAAQDAARDAAWDATLATQADRAAWLRENAKPCFEVRNE